ncbi:MAG: hypothetical protein KDE01_33860, partial [Caldilineaceae bacterium]|nr:hypothetical protein [Caldilineaceae bacterium]
MMGGLLMDGGGNGQWLTVNGQRTMIGVEDQLLMVDERRGGRHAASSGGYGGGPKPPVGNRRLAG